MRVLFIVLLTLLMSFSWAFAAGGKCSHTYSIYNSLNYFENADIDFEDGTIIITHNGRDKTIVEITEDYELFINEQQIKVNPEQKKLVKQYYHLVADIHKQAVEIGLEGAKIGREGAKLGTKAIRNVVKMFLTDYDSDDLVREMEREAARFEARAEVLEEQAEEIEEMAEELEEIAEELEEQIPELDDIIWY